MLCLKESPLRDAILAYVPGGVSMAISVAIAAVAPGWMIISVIFALCISIPIDCGVDMFGFVALSDNRQNCIGLVLSVSSSGL